jgi:hypothetical protein
MNVFIALKTPRGQERLEGLAQAAAEATRHAGHTPFVACHEIARRNLREAAQFMPFVRLQMHACGLAIVIYHPDLRGGLIEAGMAYALQIPIWLASQPGEPLSSSARGCAERLIEYRQPGDLYARLLEQYQTLPPL